MINFLSYMKKKMVAASVYVNTQGLFDGISMYFAKKIAEAAMSDGA